MLDARTAYRIIAEAYERFGGHRDAIERAIAVDQRLIGHAHELAAVRKLAVDLAEVFRLNGLNAPTLIDFDRLSDDTKAIIHAALNGSQATVESIDPPTGFYSQAANEG